MKKIKHISLLLAIAFLLSACDIFSKKHTHEWDQGNVTVEPTCTSFGKKVFSCSGCDEKKEETLSKLEHNHSELLHDEQQHWNECVCGDVNNLEEHTFDNGVITKVASCVEEGRIKYTCSKCGFVLNAVLKKESHEHDELKHDDNNHWFECGCGDINNLEEHTFDNGIVIKEATCTEEGQIKFICEICKFEKVGMIEKLPHEHTGLNNDEANHWSECECGDINNLEEHTFDQGVIIKEATCTEEGQIKFICEVCEFEKVEVLEKLPHEHTGLKNDEANHWYECECGVIVDFENHTFDDGVVVSEVSCNEFGEVIYTCTKCEYVKVVVTDKLEHNHNNVNFDELNHWNECVCGDVKDIEEHAFDNGVVIIEATCSQIGEIQYKCLECNYTKNEVIDKLDHAQLELKYDDEKHWFECECGAIEGLKKHNFDNVEVISEPSCTQYGEIRYTCSGCGFTQIAVTDKMNHSYSELNHDETSHWYECRCGDKKGLEVHTFDQGVIITESSCVLNGEIQYTCTVCGFKKVVVTEKIEHVYSELNHDEVNHWYECECGDKVFIEEHTFDEGVVIKEATCTETGELKYTCNLCGFEKVGVIDKEVHLYEEIRNDEVNHWYECVCADVSNLEEHIFNDGILIKEATCFENGQIKFACTVCGFSKLVETEKLEHNYVNTYYLFENDVLYLVDECINGHCELVVAEDKHFYEVNNERDLRTLLTNGFNVVLTSDINLTSSIYLTGDIDVIIDLAGFTVRVYWIDKEKYAEAFGAYNNAVLTIVGNGVIDGGSGSYCNGALSTNNGVINIYNGYFTAGFSSDGVNGTDLIYARTNGVINIYGGTFVATPYQGEYFTLDINEAEPMEVWGKINVYGGSFYKFDPANCKFDGSYTNKLVDGLHSVLLDDYYVVGVHNYDNGVVTKEPTYELEGELTYTCTDCGHTIVDTIEKLEIDISRVIFKSIIYVYNGQKISIFVSNLPVNTTVIYEGNMVSEVGVHLVIAKIMDKNNNLIGQLSATITIIESNDVELPWV